MMRLILGVAAALMLCAGQAAADGLPSKGHVRAMPAAGPNWDGFYVGAGIGAGALSLDDDGFDGNWGAHGVFGTVTLGYDRVIRPGWVAGVFVDYDFSDISGSAGPVDLDHAWSVGGRLGFLTNPSTLVYGTAGYTQAKFNFFDEASPTADGYFFGAGIETFLRQDWTLKLEYRFSHFDERISDGESSFSEEPSVHTARLVLSYKFGHRD